MINKKTRRAFNLLIIASLIIFFPGCETSQYKIPYARVDLHLNIIGELGNPALYSVTLHDGGVNGLIIYREDYDLFHVYDRTCTLYPEHNEKVLPDEEFEGVFTCPECDSQFLLSQAADPISGPATFGLHEYYSVVEGDLLHIYN